MTEVIDEVLTQDAVRVGAHAPDQRTAIEEVGAILVARGVVTLAYVAAMQERESIVSTYLGNGVALPHGTNETKDAILRTGIAVVQYPDGVPWGEERAHLVIGLAALGEEHLAVLSQLAAILGDAATCERLAHAPDAGEIYAALTAPLAEEAEDGTAPPLDGLRTTARITNPHGLHARPAAQVVAKLQPLDASVTIEVNGKRADARSMTEALVLGASVGDELTIVTRGPDAQAAMDAVLEVVTSGHDL